MMPSAFDVQAAVNPENVPAAAISKKRRRLISDSKAASESFLSLASECTDYHTRTSLAYITCVAR